MLLWESTVHESPACASGVITPMSTEIGAVCLCIVGTLISLHRAHMLTYSGRISHVISFHGQQTLLI